MLGTNPMLAKSGSTRYEHELLLTWFYFTLAHNNFDPRRLWCEVSLDNFRVSSLKKKRTHATCGDFTSGFEPKISLMMVVVVGICGYCGGCITLFRSVIMFCETNVILQDIMECFVEYCHFYTKLSCI